MRGQCRRRERRAVALIHPLCRPDHRPPCAGDAYLAVTMTISSTAPTTCPAGCIGGTARAGSRLPEAVTHHAYNTSSWCSIGGGGRSCLSGAAICRVSGSIFCRRAAVSVEPKPRRRRPWRMAWRQHPHRPSRLHRAAGSRVRRSLRAALIIISALRASARAFGLTPSGETLPPHANQSVAICLGGIVYGMAVRRPFRVMCAPRGGGASRRRRRRARHHLSSAAMSSAIVTDDMALSSATSRRHRSW